MTAFRLVDEKTDEKTLLGHLEYDLKILNSCNVSTKHVYRIIIGDDFIDVCAEDNGTPVSYFFTSKARFIPQSVKSEVKDLCVKFNVRYEEH